MKRTFLNRIMCIGLLSLSLLGVSSVGVMAEWRDTDKGWQYYDTTGTLVVDSWIYDKETGKNCYLNSQGIRVTGWMKYKNGKYYYFDDKGAMVKDTTIDGYKLGSDGARIDNQNTSTINGTWYYNKADGTKAIGWLIDDAEGQTYYLNTQGTMMANTWINDGDKWYYCNPNGSIAKNTTVNGYSVDNNGVWIQNNTVNNTTNTSTTNNINSGNTATNNTVSNTNNGVINSGGINTNVINNNNNYGVTINNIDKSKNTTNIIVKNTTNNVDDSDKKEASKINEKLKDYNDKESDKKLSALKVEKALWEKDNSSFAKDNIDKLQKSIDDIEFDKKYDKMSTSEQRNALISQNKEKISKLKSELEQWKKDNSIESKKHQSDIQQEIKHLENYIDIIS